MPTQNQIDAALEQSSNGWAGPCADILAAAYKSEKERADRLQKQLNNIATLRMNRRFGDYDHGRPLL